MTTSNGSLRLLAVALLLGGCSDQGPDDPTLLEEIASNRAVWAAQRPQSYVYELERLCFCGEEARGPVLVTVVGGQVVEQTYSADDTPVPSNFADLFPAVDGLFDILVDAVDRDAHEVRVTWDVSTGIPGDFWIDYIEMAVDEEVGYRVVTFPASPTLVRGNP